VITDKTVVMTFSGPRGVGACWTHRTRVRYTETANVRAPRGVSCTAPWSSRSSISDETSRDDGQDRHDDADPWVFRGVGGPERVGHTELVSDTPNRARSRKDRCVVH